MAGCSAGKPLTAGLEPEGPVDAEIDVEWDEDAPNWRHDGG